MTSARPSHVFVLCTGRCGSTTFIEACHHATNFTAGHETRRRLVGAERLAYAPGHIEADNRLSWYLGRLEETFGDRAFCVHLTRDPEKVARSHYLRWNTGIIGAYQHGIPLSRRSPRGEEARMAVCRDYVHTVTANITAFLANKSQVAHVRLEQAQSDFADFWDRIGAEGDRAAALAEWSRPHNASRTGLLHRIGAWVRALP